MTKRKRKDNPSAGTRAGEPKNAKTKHAQKNAVSKSSNAGKRSGRGANKAAQPAPSAAPAGVKPALSAERGKVQIGGTIKTQDKFLPHNPAKVQELKGKRWVVVIDKNTNEELAVVRLTDEKQPNTTELPTYKKGNKRKTFFKHFVEITDNEGKAIRVDGKKFSKNAAKYNLSKEELNIVQAVVRAHCKQAKSNKEKLKNLKSKK